MKSLKLYIPETWDKMKEKQFERIAFLFNTSETNTLFYIKLFFLLTGVKWWQFSRKAKLRIVLRNYPLSDLQKNYEFIFKENNRTVFPKSIKFKKKKFFPPQNNIADLSADEFAVADDLHIKWRKTKNIEFLYYLAAVLYTVSKERPVFNKNNLHQYAIPFSKLPVCKLLAIELAYFGCKNNLVKRFSEAFKENKTRSNKKQYGFSKVILSMAKGDLSKLESIKKVNIYSFLEQFEEDLKSAKK
ncbi:hypothetical protein [Flavobacterium panacagri]|uniref:hypothetical protein n=1 Tax=Flavobacterium panacagri TaxID=3034146 RepID=UPI0025A53D40|nr:hypothetical protein [Flavobacterium panacagri]